MIYSGKFRIEYRVDFLPSFVSITCMGPSTASYKSTSPTTLLEFVGDALSTTPELVVTVGVAVQPASTTLRGPSSILASDPVLPVPSVVDDKSADDSVGEETPVPTTTSFAEVAVVFTKCLRRSKRAAAVADMHTLHKVKLMAEKTNLKSKGYFQGAY
jgi:hypothetical protein